MVQGVNSQIPLKIVKLISIAKHFKKFNTLINIMRYCKRKLSLTYYL